MTRWPLLALLMCLPYAARAEDAPAPKSASTEAKVAAIPYRLTDTKHILVRVKINDKGPFNLILDTGAPAVFITKKIAEAANVETDKDGWATTKSFELEGGLKVAGTKTRVADLFQLEGMNGMGLAGVELHGVIGYNVLAKFRITYDFTADKLQFAPLDFTPPAVNSMGKSNSQGGLDLLGPVMKMMAGLMGIKPNFNSEPRGFLGLQAVEKDQKIVIETVWAGSPADKAGLQKGDIITGVSRKSKIDDIERLKEFTRWLNDTTGGQKTKIQVQRGEKTLVLTLELGKGV